MKLTDICKGYKVVKDECWAYEDKDYRKKHQVWYERIRLSGGGWIALYSLEKPYQLKAYTPKMRKVFRKAYEALVERGFKAEIDDRMDGWETDLIFPASEFEWVAPMLRAIGRRRAVKSPLVMATLKKYQFVSDKTG